MLIALMAVSLTAAAQETRAVFVVKKLGPDAAASDAAELWARYMDAAPDAARFFAPARFAKKLFSLDIELAADLAFSVLGSEELERSDKHVLVRYDVAWSAPPALPRAGKLVTVRFSLSELVKKNKDASPGYYALLKGIKAGPYARGQAWVVSMEYDGKGSFRAVVALAKS